MVEFILPDIGEGMHEGEIVKWLVKEGDSVERDQPIVTIQTDKVTAELPSPAKGVMKKTLFSAGETVAVGTVLFMVDDASAVSPDHPLQPSKKSPTDVKRVLATPHIRRRSRELGIDIERVQGTGPVGRVLESDLELFLSQQKTPSQIASHREESAKISAAPDLVNVDSKSYVKNAVSDEISEIRFPLSGMRKKIAEHMVKSVSHIPHVTQVDEIEMDGLKLFRDELVPYAKKKEIKLTFLPFFVKALVVALREFPMLNASIDEQTNEVIQKNYYNIGIATETEDGLIVPVIKHADRKSIFAIADEISSLATSARLGKLTYDQVSGGTFTISNMGPIGSLSATPIINYPEAAILALHKMEPRMVVRDAVGVIRLMMNMSLSFDHRIIDGVTAVRFTNRIKELLVNPKVLFAEMS